MALAERLGDELRGRGHPASVTIATSGGSSGPCRSGLTCEATDVGLLVVTHGRLAEELVNAVRTIVGTLEGLEAVSIDWDDDVAEATRRIEAAMRRVDRGAGVLILTDMFGGTPTNLGAVAARAGQVEVVTGVNLPMLIKFANLRDDPDLHEVARRIAIAGAGRDPGRFAVPRRDPRRGRGPGA